MDILLPLAERVFVVLFDQGGWWMCDGCLGEKTGAMSPEIENALTELSAAALIKRVHGVCFLCRRTGEVSASRSVTARE
jgi:hypothetical protein